MEYFAQNATRGLGSDKAWLVWALIAGVVVFSFGIRVLHKLFLLNKRHHFITIDDTTLEAWDDDDEY